MGSVAHLAVVLLLAACGGANAAPQASVAEVEESEEPELAAGREGGTPTTSPSPAGTVPAASVARVDESEGPEQAAGREGVTPNASSPPAGAGVGVMGLGLPAGPGATTPPPPHVLVSVQNLTDQLSVIGRYRRLLAIIRREVELPPRGGTPVACTSTTREDVGSLVREGYSEASGIRNYRQLLDELCDGFERWSNPDDALLGRIQRFRNRLTRIENWMKDIRACIDPGPYDHHCENSYGPAGGRDARDAVEALRMVDEVRGVIEGVPDQRRFPCRHPIWARVEARRWSQSVARAQMPHVPSEARQLCEHIGVAEPELGELVQRIRDEVDRDSARAAQDESRRRTTLTQLRAQYRLPE